MPFSPNSSSCPKKLSSEYQLYACGNFFRHSSILEKIAILGQPPSGIAVGILGFLLSPRIERRVHQWIEMKQTEISLSRVRSGETK